MKKLRTFNVLYGNGDDREVMKVKAFDQIDAINKAYLRTDSIIKAWPARRTKEERKG